LVVQVAAFASRQNADRAAASLGGSIEPAGRFFRVRLGRFATQAEAAAALAKAKAAGYSDARIQRAN
ncbi:MAG TPA: SPOR domain-containing protein, partial [Novosphingobium sp.]